MRAVHVQNDARAKIQILFLGVQNHMLTVQMSEYYPSCDYLGAFHPALDVWWLYTQTFLYTHAKIDGR